MSTATASAGPSMGKVYVELPPPRHTAKSAQKAPLPPRRRFSQVYLEMPPLSARAKENRLADPKDTSLPAAAPVSKRKRTESTSVADSTNRGKGRISKANEDQPTKKSRIVTGKLAVPGKESKKCNDEEEQPEAHCHQCHRAKNRDSVLQCTSTNLKGRRCGSKYCRNCLKSHYKMDLDAIRTPPSPVHQEQGHVSNLGYVFGCPKCEKMCDCSTCRKTNGVETKSLSQMGIKMKSGQEQSSADDELDLLPRREVSAPSDSSSGSKPSFVVNSARSKPNRVEVVIGTKPTLKTSKPIDKVSQPAQQKSAAVSQNLALPVPPKPLLPRPIPILKWTSLPVHEGFSQEAAAARIHIREFVLRFFELFDLSKARLSELDIIGGNAVAVDEDADEDCITSSWVSEVCLREILVGLLVTIGEDAKAPEKKAIEIALKTLQNSGANLTKMSTALFNLGAILQSCGSTLPKIPEPLAPPSNLGVYNTRGAAKADGVPVAYTAQMVPVVTALIDAALTTSAVREILDTGNEELKECQREAREATKFEREKWDADGGGKTKTKPVCQAHKQRLADIDRAINLVNLSYTSRCTPLGTDSAGRMYWVLTPGQGEREAVQDILTVPSEKKGTSSRRHARSTRTFTAPSADRRGAMDDWTWLVAVWGTKPPSPSKPTKDLTKANTEDEEEQWWGFWDPIDITDLAEWVDITHGTSERVDKASPAISSLVTGLRGYAQVLGWRCRPTEQALTETGREPSTKKSTMSTVDTGKFYS